MIEVSGANARVELGEGIQATCSMHAVSAKKPPSASHSSDASSKIQSKVDLSSLGSMLQARWKGGPVAEDKSESARSGQIRKFRITKLDPAAKKIELELA
jgi:small subunit ribosomal protein S1